MHPSQFAVAEQRWRKRGMSEIKRCLTCEDWYTNEYIQKHYGEGEGRCKVLNDITFCDKHNCMFHKEREEIANGGSEK